MVNLVAPTAIIFLNNEVVAEIQSVIKQQFFIDDTMDGYEFDARVIVDPNYVQQIHGNNLRILVIRAANDYTNRNLADLVLYASNGLISVEKNKFGMPTTTYPITHAYLSQIFNTMV